MKRVFITGSAGFIGFHLSKLLLKEGFRVQGFDGMTDYYDVKLKRHRHEILLKDTAFTATEALLEDEEMLSITVEKFQPDVIIHLAAQAGVRYSLQKPRIYLQSNVIGTFNLMEAAQELAVKHLLMASTSSVYGSNEQMPFMETDKADTQLSIYAATKKANESMAHAYAHLWNLPTTMFRFFTVYGPLGRPDLALFKFVDAILDGRPIDIYNNGEMFRDFTYVDDIAAGSVSALKTDGFGVFNLGSDHPVELNYLISLIEKYLNKNAEIQFLTPHRADAPVTWAQIDKAKSLLNWEAKVSIEEGIKNSVEWYLENRNWIIEMQQEEDRSVKE